MNDLTTAIAFAGTRCFALALAALALKVNALSLAFVLDSNGAELLLLCAIGALWTSS